MVYTIVVHLYAKDSPESISKLHNKLLEASEVYSKDHETISWFVMQDHQNKRAFTIVERYEQESVCCSHFLSRTLAIAPLYSAIIRQAGKCTDEVPWIYRARNIISR